MKIYIAAPLFSHAERLFNDYLFAAIERTCAVYLPQRHGTLVEVAIRENCEDANSICQRVYNEDISAIREADAVLAVLEGRALDEGVCIEMGYAKALGKFIVGYKSDVRVTLPWGHNPMVFGCVDAWVDSTEGLSTCVAHLASGIGYPGAQRLGKPQNGRA